MRSFLLILATILFLAGGVAVYTWMQPASARKPVRTMSALNKQRPQLEQTMRGVGEGTNPWMKSWDAKTGELKSQIRADKWDPQKDNTVNVTKPQAEFFSGDGRQRVRIDGTDGNVVLPATPEDKSNKFQSSGQPSMPTRGKLHNVLISIFDPVDSPEPLLTAKMNNAAFDTDNFRIATEAYTDEKGATVEAEQVPVTVRGRDYDFDGRGLVIRWNERDRKLQLLQIEHGESLVIKNPAALSRPGLVPTTQSSVAPWRNSPLDGMLASADPAAHRLLLTAAKPQSKAAKARAAAKKRRPVATTTAATRPHPTRDLTPVVYRATFERDVRILEPDEQGQPQPVATAQQMFIDMLQESSKSASTQPTGTTKPSSRSSTHPARSKTARRAESTTQSAPDSPESALKGPITVKWTGKLRVVPLEGTPEAALVPGKAIVHLLGAPATLNRNGMNAACGEAIFNAADNSSSLLPGPAVPQVTMTTKEADGSEGFRVVTPRVNYLELPDGSRTATLIGSSTAEIPIAGQDSAKREMMNARWSEQCTLLMKSVSGSMMMDRADLSGDVRVDHPSMNLSSQALQLSFDPNAPTTRRSATSKSTSNPSSQASTRKSTSAPVDIVSTSLREIIATGNAHCEMRDEKNPQTIDTQRLRVQLSKSPEGEPYPEILEADGDVRTRSGKDDKVQTLQAGHMTAHLAPATKPAATRPVTQPAATQASARSTTHPALASSRPTSGPFATGDARLISLVATDNVIITSGDDSVASAHELHVDTINDQQRYTLIGKPDAMIVSGKGPGGKTTIVGPKITFDPERNLAQIIGGGSVDGVDPKEPKKDMKLRWTGDATIDGNTDLIDVDRDVVVNSVDPSDGTVNTATAKHLQAKLTTTQPATKPAAQPVQVAATGPSKRSKGPADSQSVSFMKDKEITSGTLSGDVNITSELKAADGFLLRGVKVKAEEAMFDNVTGRMEIPVKGQMLYQDHRPPTTREAASKPADGEGPTLGSGRGATAFGWEKSLVYDRSLHNVVMTGDVNVVHNPETNNGEPFTVKGQTLTATVGPKPSTQPADAATQPDQPTTNPADQFEQLKLVTVAGDVHVTSTRYNIDADELTFDPNEQIITAKGEARHPITFFDNKTGNSQTALELYWNTKTDKLSVKGPGGKMRQ